MGTSARSLAEQQLVNLVAHIRSLTESHRRQGATLDPTRKIEHYEILLSRIGGVALDALLAVSQTGSMLNVAEPASFHFAAEAPSMVHVMPVVSEPMPAPEVKTREDCRL